MTNFATCEKYRIRATASTGGPPNGIVPAFVIPALSRSRFLEKPGGEPSQILNLDLRALDEVFRSMLNHDDPAKRCDREKNKPEQ
jgi:hypothetical protein